MEGASVGSATGVGTGDGDVVGNGVVGAGVAGTGMVGACVGLGVGGVGTADGTGVDVSPLHMWPPLELQREAAMG